MRLIEFAAVSAFVVGCATIFRALWARAARPSELWVPYHRFEEDRRRVYVRRDTELEPVGEVAPGDPSYDESFMLLMAEARERAATLNSER